MPPPIQHQEAITTQYTANNNFDKNAVLVKPHFLIEVLIKGVEHSFIANKFTANASYVIFNGVEIPKGSLLTDFRTKDQVDQVFKGESAGERYYPWSSVVEIISKRYA